MKHPGHTYGGFIPAFSEWGMTDPKGLPGVTTVRLGVAGVLLMVSEPTLMVSRACTGQLRRIQWRTGQGCGYVRKTRGSSRRDMVWYVCC
jgi:hypothetical protein